MADGKNPLTGMDHPDPDVIRVGDTYYMICTTMHFFPGGEILRSRDLINWELCSYVFDRLEDTPGETLEDGDIYGHGMWAASLRYHGGKFYVVFIAHEWDRTFLFTADSIEGPWKKSYIEGIYHDPSLLFDDDGRVYIVYGNRDIRLTELNDDLSVPKPGGLDRIIVRDAPGCMLGYEGSHIYKLGQRYLLFLIHSKQQEWYRTQACFMTEDLNGVWAGGDVMCDDLDGLHSGPAQGGIVDTPDGRWFSVVFQDRGAIGRVPVLVPVSFNAAGYPVFGKVTQDITNAGTRPETPCGELWCSDDFTSPKLGKLWQFNHEPREGCFETGSGAYIITTDKLSPTLLHARNTITQRTVLPCCAAEVTLDASRLNDGDVAGLCLLIGSYGLAGIANEGGRLFLVMKSKDPGSDAEAERERLPAAADSLRLRAEVRFEGMTGEVRFSVQDGSAWSPVGTPHKFVFSLDHFTGARFGLFMYSTGQTGGSAAFSEFRYLPYV
ncbi:MAG: glycoside hydrolase 43 family protein [Ruminococcus sp.]|nr:glycoside hydrolase 43 family protein [Ruminococcus sp.]